jgi:formate hydrogenlyase subunit 6/NADH:ubiquinone oxidoreductase subunit I
MIEASLDVYRNLQKHLDKFAVGFPETKSGVELRILKHLFTPEEANLAVKLTDKFESLDVINERARDLVSSRDELKTMLDTMIQKGSIHYKIEDDQKKYANAYLVIGMYEYQLKRLDKDFLMDMKQYADEALGLELFGYGITQFRTVPVEASITPEHHLPTYDELVEIIEDIDGPLSLSDCICREAQKMMGEPCKTTSRTETCLGFGELAQLYIDQGWGREVTKQDALKILRENQKDGLVLQGENAKRPGFICSCCGCCCGVLSSLIEFPNVVNFLNPRYHAEIDSELCTGCGTCIEICQLQAIKTRKEKSKVNLKRCIGCGNCVANCPEEAIKLVKNQKIKEPPETKEDMYEEILLAKHKIKGIE